MRSFVVAVLMVAVVGCGTFPGGTRAVTAIGPYAASDAATHQARIQACLDEGRGVSREFRFAPGDYVLQDAAGLRVPSGATLRMTGARFLLSKEIGADGQAFLVDGGCDIRFEDGEIIGARSVWSDSVNVAGIRVVGASRGIRIVGLTCRDLSSNGVGVFGTSEVPIRDVRIERMEGVNCCNEYVDYLQPNKGPAPGSDRCDQGTVAFYFVDGWAVSSSRFIGSHSDGTHFFKCRFGRFSHCAVEGSRMGGYFLEGCENVDACGNEIRDNGSRGVTIERDSLFCGLWRSLIEHSGREGLWMPDVRSIIVEGNRFVENGRKDDGERDCEIRLDDGEEYGTRTEHVFIRGNTFRTSVHQTAVVFWGPGVEPGDIGGNVFRGYAPRENRTRQPDGDPAVVNR